MRKGGFERWQGDVTRNTDPGATPICSESEELPRLSPRIRESTHATRSLSRTENVKHYLQPSGAKADRSTCEIKYTQSKDGKFQD